MPSLAGTEDGLSDLDSSHALEQAGVLDHRAGLGRGLRERKRALRGLARRRETS
ncbi:MAG: hypothetical protein O7F16_07375 [Acidobacteria bacterium]|nr:hypothetical protein [Acidobacteriota bacterium]